MRDRVARAAAVWRARGLERGHRVTGLRPGLIDTDIQSDTGVENRIARFGPTVPIGRGGTAEEVAAQAEKTAELAQLREWLVPAITPPASAAPSPADRPSPPA